MTNNFELNGYDATRLRVMPYADFLQTPYWKSVAAHVKERDGRKCVVCNSAKRIAAHHRTYRNHGAEHLNAGDLTTLCEDCHQRHHFPPPPQVVVKTVIQKVVEYRADTHLTPDGAWVNLPKNEKRFYRKAAMKLCIKAKKLAQMGRATVLAMLDRPPAAPKVTPPLPPVPMLNGCAIVGDLASVEADMPEGDAITLTKAILDKCRANGSFTSETVKAFGLKPGDMRHGWIEELIGKVVPRAQMLAAMRGRHLYSPATFKSRRKREAREAAAVS